MAVTYRLERSQRQEPQLPVLDDDQRAVVDHPGGPLLVLAGPGTGKTTTLVEAVVDRIERRGLDPSQVLVLTFSRKAAEELRDKITARVRRTTALPISSTFHSFCYGLVRSCQSPELYTTPLRLLSSPEQDVRLRELLRHSRELGTVAWPDGRQGPNALNDPTPNALSDPTPNGPGSRETAGGLDAALGTRGFAREVHALLSRARELGMSPDDLVRLGKEAERPEWEAAGTFMEEYLSVLDFEGALDYSELIHRAVLLAETNDVRADLRNRFAAVFVDEYQDTDPGQVRLLRALAGDGRDLVVVGDPDQSIYAFRGADVRGILDFPAAFPQADGSPAPVIALGTTRRFGSRLLRASRGIAAGIGVGGAIDADTFRRFRNPVAAAGDHGPGRVEVLTYSSSGAQADHIADLVRRSHLEDGVPWSQIAVLVRSGMVSIPGLRRALVGADVPVAVAGDEVPLRAEPAVQPLLLALSAALDPAAMSSETTHALVTSPLADVDAAALRRLGRALRRQARLDGQAGIEGQARIEGQAGIDGDGARAPSAELLRLALVEPSLLAEMTDFAAVAVRRLGLLLRRVHHQLVADQPAEEALWALWQGTRWPRRLRASVERGGPAARSANRDLDSICALFDLAARAEEKQQHTSVAAFLDEIQAQQIPADSRADVARGGGGDAVRLLTAHRSKGLEWRVVVIAGVQEGSWPDVRRRGSLLQADRLGADCVVDPPGVAAMLAEERRLFYVAATRARERLVVTAVAAPEQDGEQPSRLLDVLGRRPTSMVGRPERPLSLTGLVAALRRVAGDPAQSDGLRLAAAARLARLTDERVGGRPLAPAADPASWWGLRERSHSAAPVRPADEPLTISASMLSGLLDCPLRWFLAREAAGEAPGSSAMGFGNVVHVLADHLARAGDATEEELASLLDGVWGRLAFDSPWIAARERAEAGTALRRLLAWHRGRPHRDVLGTERDFEVGLSLDNGERLRLRGRVDRLERDADGAMHVVDLKTSKNPPSGTSLPDNPQLGLYQLAVDRGAFAELAGRDARSGGAELVQLLVAEGDLPKVQEQPPQQPDESGRTPVEVQLTSAAGAVRAERFDATRGRHCTFCDFRSMCPAQVSSGTVLA